MVKQLSIWVSNRHPKVYTSNLKLLIYAHKSAPSTVSSAQWTPTPTFHLLRPIVFMCTLHSSVSIIFHTQSIRKLCLLFLQNTPQIQALLTIPAESTSSLILVTASAFQQVSLLQLLTSYNLLSSQCPEGSFKNVSQIISPQTLFHPD